MQRCSICHTLIRTPAEETRCPECDQAYHETCWDELGGCATYGCSRVAVAEKPPPPHTTPQGWGDEKACPRCKRTLHSGSLRCPCGATFPYADPMSTDEYGAWVDGETKVARTRRLLLALFLLSLPGFPAPVTGAVATVIAVRSRHALAGAQGTWLAMGYGAGALGAFYTIAMLMLAAGF